MDKERVMTEAEWLAKYNANQKKSKKKSAKKWVRNGVALGLVAVLSIAGTLAYLQKQSEEKTNTFVGSTGLKLMLTENKWDPNNNDTPDDGEPSKEAQAYIPGNSYAKNPQLINGQTDTWADVNIDSQGTGDVAKTDTIDNLDSGYQYSEYVALQMDLINTNDSDNPAELGYGTLTHVIDDIVFASEWQLIAYYSGNTWVKAADGDMSSNKLVSSNSTLMSATKLVFAYKTSAGYTKLSSNTATTPLFSKISIKQDVYDFTSGLGVKVTDPLKYPKFDIVLNGAAIDTDTYENTTNGISDKQGQIEKDLLAVLGITIS